MDGNVSNSMFETPRSTTRREQHLASRHGFRSCALHLRRLTILILTVLTLGSLQNNVTADDFSVKQSSSRTQANLSKTDVTEHSRSIRRFPVNNDRSNQSIASTANEFMLDLEDPSTPIDLPAALQLGGWKSPQVLLAQQRILAATAVQQLAAAQALPNLNLGTNYDQHSGALQRSSGQILSVNRNALYVGAGANAVGAGTVNLPGLQYNLNVGESYFNFLASQQRTERARAAALTAQNVTLLQIASAYIRLVRAQGIRAIAVKIRDHAAEVARVTAEFAKAGQGRPADAERRSVRRIGTDSESGILGPTPIERKLDGSPARRSRSDSSARIDRDRTLPETGTC